MKLPVGRKNRIYIMPTGFGFLFVCGAFLMVMVGAAYQNNLVNMLAFFMLSLVFVSMVQTHNNVRDLSIEGLEIDDGFAGPGGEITATVVLKNSANEPRFALEATLEKKKPSFAFENHLPLVSGGRLKLRTVYKTDARGHFSEDTVVVRSSYPLGLFRSWVRMEAPTSNYFVYPERNGPLPLPAGDIGDTAKPVQERRGGDDFHGHRKKQWGDSANHVDWKAFARGRPLMIKQFDDGSPQALHFNFASLPDIGVEAKLSQLSIWIDQALKRQVPYSLKIHDMTFIADSGPAHAVRCLSALAVYTEGAKDA